MTTTTETCWADPLSRMERKELRLKLARASKQSWNVAEPHRANAMSDEEYDTTHALIMTSAEMADLHLDVTERAEVPAP